jgi:hypothetical protein
MVPPVTVTLEDARFVTVPVAEVRLTIVPLVADKLEPVAETNESEVIVPLVEFSVEIVPLVAPKEPAKMLAPVAFVKVSVPSDEAPETASVVNEPFVANRFVDVTLVKMPVEGVVAPMAVPLIDPPLIVAFAEMNVGAVSVVIVPLVAKKFVPVADVNDNELIVPFVTNAFVEVTVANTPFQRRDAEPSDNAASAVGSRFEVTPPVTAKNEEVPLVRVVFWSEVVPVTVRFETVAPP